MIGDAEEDGIDDIEHEFNMEEEEGEDSRNKLLLVEQATVNNTNKPDRNVSIVNKLIK